MRFLTALWPWLLRLGGFAIALTVAINPQPDDWPRIVLAGAMMGLSITIPADRSRSRDEEE